jgi:hypothetical protein
MTRDDFRSDTRCTISWRNPQGRVQPATVYIFKVCERFLIGRMAGDDALLRRIDYEDVLKVVSVADVAPADRYTLPAAMADEKAWRDRVVMQHYSTSPRRGK